MQSDMVLYQSQDSVLVKKDTTSTVAKDQTFGKEGSMLEKLEERSDEESTSKIQSISSTDINNRVSDPELAKL